VVAADINPVSVDIFDMTGKCVSARTILDGFINTVLDLNPRSGPGQALAGGLYMVNITTVGPKGTAGDKTYTERLVIQP